MSDFHRLLRMIDFWAIDKMGYMSGSLSSNFYAKIFTTKAKVTFGNWLSHEV